MSNPVIKVENLSKQYRLGEVGTGTISHDLNRWWHRIRGKEDPYLRIGETNDRSSKGNSEYVWALQDINFEVQQGEVLGIIGKNGAGKSTLLKILSKVTAPTTGSIKAKGRIASLLEVGTGFHPELTGRENIYLNGTILGMSKQEVTAKLDEIVDFSGVERYLDTPVKRYSSGMMVRLGFAVAAHLEPEILIVDEVLAVGDAEFQKKAVGKMQEVSKEGGRTVLFVSHNMASISALCTKIIVLKNGSLIYEGNKSDGIEKYLEYSYDNSNEVDVEEYPRSAGSAKVIKKIWIENEAKAKTNQILMGEGFSICVKFDSSDLINNPLFGFGVEDNNYIRIFSLNNEISGDIINKTAQKGIVKYHVKAPNLNQGRFYISCSIVSNGAWVDYIERAITIIIEPNDVFKTGKILTPTQGVIYLKGVIEISE